MFFSKQIFSKNFPVSKKHLNTVTEVIQPEIPPDVNELIFTLHAMKSNYTDVQFGRITVGGQVHTCVSYVMNQKGWVKKYLIVLNGFGYDYRNCSPKTEKPEVEETWIILPDRCDCSTQ